MTMPTDPETPTTTNHPGPNQTPQSSLSPATIAAQYRSKLDVLWVRVGKHTLQIRELGWSPWSTWDDTDNAADDPKEQDKE